MNILVPALIHISSACHLNYLRCSMPFFRSFHVPLKLLNDIRCFVNPKHFYYTTSLFWQIVIKLQLVHKYYANLGFYYVIIAQ